MRIVPLAAALGLTLTLCGASSSAGDKPEAKTHRVTIDAMLFTPAELTVAPGDTIVWVNDDLVAHTATSESGGFDSKTIEAGNSWTYTASKKGDFTYICTRHPKMTGVLHVR